MLWSRFSEPGQYLNVQVLRGQGLPPRPREHTADSGGGGDYGGVAGGAAALAPRSSFVFVRVWPPSRTGEEYRTRVANATNAPEWKARGWRRCSARDDVNAASENTEQLLAPCTEAAAARWPLPRCRSAARARAAALRARAPAAGAPARRTPRALPRPRDDSPVPLGAHLACGTRSPLSLPVLTRTCASASSPLSARAQQEFTFDQGSARARKIALQLFDAPSRGSPLWLGTAMARPSHTHTHTQTHLRTDLTRTCSARTRYARANALTHADARTARSHLCPSIIQVPVPAPSAEAVSVDVRQSMRAVAGEIVEGWYPFFARPEGGDYEGGAIPPPAVAEAYVRVSFAQRRTHSGYCEEVRLESPVAQPMDSYSNVLFAVTGLHMIAVGVLDAWRPYAARRAAAGASLSPPLAWQPHVVASGMERFAVYSIANGLTQFYAGLSSFLFHASMTSLGQRLDMAGVYMLVVSPSLYILLRLGAFGPPSGRVAHTVFLAATAICAYALYAYKWQLERYTHGSTNMVLDLVAIMASLIVRAAALLCCARRCHRIAFSRCALTRVRVPCVCASAGVLAVGGWVAGRARAGGQRRCERRRAAADWQRGGWQWC
jgi:hypothetical protein